MWNSWDDVVSDFDDWLILLNHLDGDCEDLERKCGKLRERYEKIPHFGNIRQILVAERLLSSYQYALAVFTTRISYQCGM